MSTNTLVPVEPFLHRDRADRVMSDLGLDALFGCGDDNLYYLSGHAPDSVLCHFYDNWAVAVLPRRDGAPGCLVTSEYDIAYTATHRTWMPEIRLYGAEWSSASGLMKEIRDGAGVDTDLRGPLRALDDETRPRRAADLVSALAAYVEEHLPAGPVRLGFDDLRLGQKLADRLGARCSIVDARWAFRRIRLVKTAAEIAALKAAARINEGALIAAARAIAVGAPWMAMIDAYRGALAAASAKPAGERGMLFGAGPDGSFVLDNDYVAGKRFAAGDSVVLDAISTYRLYYADMARTAVLGAPTVRQRSIFRAVAEVLEEAEQSLRPGVHTRALEEKAARLLQRHGLEPRLATLVFHPIGLAVFDYGSAEEVSGGWAVDADTVMNFEVFYRDPEAGGIHLEDTVRVTAGGLDRFSTLGRDLIVAG